MHRKHFAPRPGWEEKLRAIGFGFYNLPSADGSPYWQECAGYELSGAEVDQLEAATEELHAMCMEFVAKVVESGEYPEGYRLSDIAKRLIESSWEKEEAALYGRFDLAYDGHGVRLLEYNADTPTGLLEAAVAQWKWVEDRGLEDQFNSIHEKLIKRWRKVGSQVVGVLPRIHFAAMKEAGREDWGTIEYLMDTVIQAGLETQALEIEQLGWSEVDQMFVDLDNREILGLFKLYPWEFMMTDTDAPHYGQSSTRFIEPPWKMLLSNKGLLPELWKQYPGHPLLLPAHYSTDVLPRTGKWAKKPLLSREGANVSVVEGGVERLAPGSEVNSAYGGSGYVLQEWTELPQFDGFRPVIGSWVIGDESAGIGIREDLLDVTGNNSHFAPHYFL